MVTSTRTASPHERAQAISAKLAATGAVRIGELAGELGVSSMTIRRDLEDMETEGLLRRVRGGALPVGAELFGHRHKRNAKAKRVIATKLLRHVPDVGVVALDASSTMLHLANALEGARDLTVVTNGIDILEALQDKPGIKPILTGGSIDRRTGSFVGPMAVRAAGAFSYTAFLTSGAAIDAIGTSEPTLEEAEVKRTLASCAQAVIVGVDSSKFDRRDAARMFTLDSIDVFVTELDPGHSRLSRYQAVRRIV